MASLGVFTIGTGGGDEAVRYLRAPAAARERALGLLLTGEARGHDAAVAEFMRFAGEHGLDLRELWAAMSGERLLASALMVPGAGRTGMLFVAPVRNREAVRATGGLAAALLREVDAKSCALVQSLLDPPQHREAEALTAAGFAPLANLVYMQRGIEPMAARVAQPEFGDGLRVVHWDERHRDLYERAILASYADTLDCPKLLGLRAIEDVLAGHQATGKFDPSMWFVLVDPSDEPAAVMLLNELPGRSSVELVYLGLSAAWRGRGLARRLLEHGIDLAARSGLATMMLAVDEINAPALTLYRGMAFRPTARKRALIRVVGEID